MGRHYLDAYLWNTTALNQGVKILMKTQNKEWVVTVIISMFAGAGYFYSFYNIVPIKLSLLFSFAMSGVTGAFMILLLQEVLNDD